MAYSISGSSLQASKSRIHQDGRHELEKHKVRSVTVDTKHGKVVGIAAGDFPVKRVKSGSKMASLTGGLTLASFELAQDDSYYGYCVDDGDEYDCYWYPASDVDDPSGDWAPNDRSYRSPTGRRRSGASADASVCRLPLI